MRKLRLLEDTLNLVVYTLIYTPFGMLFYKQINNHILDSWLSLYIVVIVGVFYIFLMRAVNLLMEIRNKLEEKNHE